MFVDEIIIHGAAGRGGDGVVRWRQEKFVDRGGPVGGNGGHGGDIYMKAVRDLNLLARYTGAKSFVAEDGMPGETMNRHGKAGSDLVIEVPVGSTVTDQMHNRIFTFIEEGETHKVLKGGIGGLGNAHFKSATNRSPDTASKGKSGEKGSFYIELALMVDVGIIGFPNAGKSTLLNTLTRAHSKIGAYPFTTTEPYLGDFHGFVLADIPGLIEGASQGRGLGHKFLRHVRRTKMLLHCVSAEESDVVKAYTTIRGELSNFDESLPRKNEIVVLTKSDLLEQSALEEKVSALRKNRVEPIVVSASIGTGIPELGTALSRELTVEPTLT